MTPFSQSSSIAVRTHRGTVSSGSTSISVRTVVAGDGQFDGRLGPPNDLPDRDAGAPNVAEDALDVFRLVREVGPAVDDPPDHRDGVGDLLAAGVSEQFRVAGQDVQVVSHVVTHDAVEDLHVFLAAAARGHVDVQTAPRTRSPSLRGTALSTVSIALPSAATSRRSTRSSPSPRDRS